MARMTLSEAAAVAADLDKVLDRLKALHDGELEGSKGNQPRRSWKEWRHNRIGRLHELKQAQELAAKLSVGLASVGPARNGQVGGQRQGGMATALAAMELVAPKAGTQRERVLAALRRNAEHYTGTSALGMTDVELANRTGLPPNSLRPRRVELVDAGWVEDSGQRRLHAGREHVVWTLTAAARHTERATTSNPDRSST